MLDGILSEQRLFFVSLCLKALKVFIQDLNIKYSLKRLMLHLAFITEANMQLLSLNGPKYKQNAMKRHIIFF